MAQTYKMMLGTSGKQWEQLTVKDDGTMTMYFHGTDRSVTQEVTVITEGEWKGWLRSEKGSLWPGLESGRWNKMDDGRCKMEDVVETTTFAIKREQGDTCINHAEREQSQDCESSVNYTNNEPVIVADEPLTMTPEPLTINQPRPRRQRKPRMEHQEPLTVNRQASDTLKAVGIVAAATVALFVIYETGLLIPLGLIGLATGGLLK